MIQLPHLACVLFSLLHHSQVDDTSHSPTPELPTAQPSASSNRAVVTIITDTPHPNDEDVLEAPEPKKARLSPTLPTTHCKPIINSAGIMAAAAAGSNSQNLSNLEVQAVRQLVAGEACVVGRGIGRGADVVSCMASVYI